MLLLDTKKDEEFITAMAVFPGLNKATSQEQMIDASQVDVFLFPEYAVLHKSINLY